MFVDFAKTVYTLKEGTFVVDPRYKVLSSIGRGAQGLICAARDTCAPEPMEGRQEDPELIVELPTSPNPSRSSLALATPAHCGLLGQTSASS